MGQAPACAPYTGLSSATSSAVGAARKRRRTVAPWRRVQSRLGAIMIASNNRTTLKLPPALGHEADAPG